MELLIFILVAYIVAYLLIAAITGVAGQAEGVIQRRLEPTTYRSKDGSAYFRFSFLELAGGFRIYILEFPNPGRGSCHILRDIRGLYVCWSEPIRTLQQAQAVAKSWAEATLAYQRTGRAF